MADTYDNRNPDKHTKKKSVRKPTIPNPTTITITLQTAKLMAIVTGLKDEFKKKNIRYILYISKNV